MNEGHLMIEGPLMNEARLMNEGKTEMRFLTLHAFGK